MAEREGRLGGTAIGGRVGNHQGGVGKLSQFTEKGRVKIYGKARERTKRGLRKVCGRKAISGRKESRCSSGGKNSIANSSINRELEGIAGEKIKWIQVYSQKALRKEGTNVCEERGSKSL